MKIQSDCCTCLTKVHPTLISLASTVMHYLFCAQNRNEISRNTGYIRSISRVTIFFRLLGAIFQLLKFILHYTDKLCARSDPQGITALPLVAIWKDLLLFASKIKIKGEIISVCNDCFSMEPGLRGLS